MGAFGREWLQGERSLCLWCVLCLTHSQCWWLFEPAACWAVPGRVKWQRGSVWGWALLGEGDKHQPESPLASACPAPRHCQQRGVASVPLSPGESWVAQRWLCLSSVNCQLDPGD